MEVKVSRCLMGMTAPSLTGPLGTGDTSPQPLAEGMRDQLWVSSSFHWNGFSVLEKKNISGVTQHHQDAVGKELFSA